MVSRGEEPLESRGEGGGAPAEGEQELVDTGLLRAQAREEVVADEVARDRRIAVGRVLDRLEAGFGEVALDLGPRHREQRPPDRAAPLRDSGERLDRPAAQHAQQHGLDLIVALMCGQDPRRAELGSHALEDSVTHPPRRRLGALAAPAACREVGDLEPEGEPEANRELPRPLGARGGLRIQSMIDMDEVERGAIALGEWRERRGQRE